MAGFGGDLRRLNHRQDNRVAVIEAVLDSDIYIINKFIKMEWNYVLASVVFSFVGIIVLGISFLIFEMITPENLWKEIIEKQNIALAIVSAAFMIAIAIIIGAAVHA